MGRDGEGTGVGRDGGEGWEGIGKGRGGKGRGWEGTGWEGTGVGRDRDGKGQGWEGMGKGRGGKGQEKG